MTDWYCPDCNTIIQEKNRLRHQESMKHRSKVQRLQECEICYESKNRHTFKKCTQCIHSWCTQCNRKMKQCPFCRKACAPQVQFRNNPEIISSPESPTYISAEDVFAFVNVVLEFGNFIYEFIICR
jgi:hypothetical protein